MSIEVRIDDRTRIVSSVMLMTDFVHENEKCGLRHPLKTRTIDFLADFTDHPCVAAARRIAEKFWMHSFHSFAIVLPEEASTLANVDLDGHVVGGKDFELFDGEGFGSLLYRFYADTGIQTLWDDTREEWETAREDLIDIVRTAKVEAFLDLVFGETDRRLVLVPNPLDPPTFGFGPSDGKICYSLLGAPVTSERNPSGRYALDSQMTADTVFHEFCHPLWDWARDTYPAIVDETAALESTMEYRGYFPESYDTWESKLGEILIRAATAHYVAHRDGEDKVQAFLEKEKSWYGIDLIDTVFQALGEYLEARKRGDYSGLSEYVPELSKAIQAAA